MNLSYNDLSEIGVKNKQLLAMINKLLPVFEINTEDRFTGFFMNILHETGGLVYLEELSSGDQYDLRVDLGNTPIKDGDGRKYKGRGAAHVTGKTNYELFTIWCKKEGLDVDFVKYPEKLKEPEYAILSAFWFWESNNFNIFADKKQFYEISSIWNTGKIRKNKSLVNGLEDRMRYMEKIQKWLLKI